MATLDDLDPKSYPPLDILTPIATQRGLPTQQFKDRQAQFERTIIAQHNENRAAIREEAEVRAGADFANALYVNEATAEALGFEAATMVRMESGVSPAGVIARYQIVGRIVGGGTQYLNGIYFDFVEDPDNPGQYLGQVQVDTDRFKLGRADENGTFPFYLDGGVVYIESAVIKNLSIGTEKIDYSAITDLTIAYQGVAVSPDGNEIVSAVVPAAATGDSGVLIQLTGFITKPVLGPSNFGEWRYFLRRNGVEIASSPTLYYDDDIVYPLAFVHPDVATGLDPLYDFQASLFSGDGNFEIIQCKMIASRFKR